MKSFDQMCKRLKEMIDLQRYQHTLGVIDTALRLAEHYRVSVEKAKIAALLHDCAKGLSKYHLLRRLKGSDIVVDDVELSLEPLMHGPVGAIIAREEFGIIDDEILRAIRYHTTGSVEMTLLDKIIFIADYIEPNRQCPGIDEVRQMAFIDLDQAIILAAGRTIIYEINRHNPIHLRTVQMRNALLERVKRNDKERL